MKNDCGTCHYCAFRALKNGNLQYECRRYAPRGLYPSGSVMSPFPVIKPDMWCGEYAAGEAKEIEKPASKLIA